MATIASMAVQLEASPVNFIAGISKAKNAMSGAMSEMTAIAGRVNSAVDRIGAGAAGLNLVKKLRAGVDAAAGLATKLGGIGSQAAGGDFVGALRTSVDAAGSLASKLAIAGSTAAGLPAVGMAASAAIGAVASSVGGLLSSLEKVKSVFEEGAAKILEQRNAAITLGESFKETAALAMAAGGDVERMTRAMVHLNSTIQSARTGDSGAIALLAGRLRLNPEKMAMQGTAQRLESVIHALGSLNDELTRSSVELGIFGERSALAFGPLLSSGNGLAKFREQVDRFGFSLGASSSGEMKAMADRVLEAKRAVNQLSMAWEGVKMNVAAGLAPALAKTAELFTTLGIDAKRIQEWSMTGAMVLAKAGAAAYESWKMLESLWDYLKHGFLQMVIGMEQGLQSLLEKLAELPDILGGAISKELAQDLAREIKRLDRARDEAAKSIDKRKKERSAFDRVDDFFASMKRDTERRKELAEKAEGARRNYEPMRAPIQLAGAAEFGSQEAYKTLGTFAAGQNANIAQRQLAQAQRIEEAIKRGDITLKDIRNILKRHGVVKVGKI